MTDKPRRRPMTKARKVRIQSKQLDAAGVARCGCQCGAAVPLTGPTVVYEHQIPFWMRPDLDDDGPNVQAWAASCSAAKTAGKGGDLSRIAKTKRQAKKMGVDQPAEREAPKMSGGRKLPGKGQGPKLKGRGFATGGPKRKIENRRSFR